MTGPSTDTKGLKVKVDSGIVVYTLTETWDTHYNNISSTRHLRPDTLCGTRRVGLGPGTPVDQPLVIFLRKDVELIRGVSKTGGEGH